MLARNIHDEDTIELQLSPAELEALARAAEAAEAAERAPPAIAAPVPIIIPTPTRAPAALATVDAELAAAIAPSVGKQRAPAGLPTSAPARTAVARPVAPSVAAPTAAAPRAMAPLIVERAPAPVQAVAQTPMPRRRRDFLGLQVAAAVAVAIAAAVAIFSSWPAARAPGPAATPAAAPTIITAPAHKAAPQPAPPPATQLATTAEPPPVRFANPFDASEVFEFPAGTSYVEARDQVARALRARALERNVAPAPARKTTATSRPGPSENNASLARQL